MPVSINALGWWSVNLSVYASATESLLEKKEVEWS